MTMSMGRTQGFRPTFRYEREHAKVGVEGAHRTGSLDPVPGELRGPGGGGCFGG